MAGLEQAPKFHSGQRVKIITCPHNHPLHAGQVGTVAPQRTNTLGIRVYVGTGICQATEVVALDGDIPQEAT
jgi:hypothetical protein